MKFRYLSAPPSSGKVPSRFDGRIVAGAATGSKWEVMLIKSGISQNVNPETGHHFYYEPNALKAKMHLFEGKPAYAFELAKDYFGHIPDGNAAVIKVGAGLVKSIVGYYSDVRWGSDEQGNEGILGNLTITDPQVMTTLRETWNAGIKDFVGLSIDGGADLEEKTIGGVLVDAVDLGELDSIDIVTSPAAGGKRLRMVAALSNPQGDKMTKALKAAAYRYLSIRRAEGLKRILEAADDAAATKILKEEIGADLATTPKEAAPNEAMGALLKEALAALEAGNLELCASKLSEALGKATPAAEAPKPAAEGTLAPAPAPAASPAPVTEGTKKVDELEKQLNAIKTQLADKEATDLVAASNLPQPSKVQVLESLKGTNPDMKRVTECIAAKQAELAALGYGGGQPGQFISVSADNKVDAFEALIATLKNESRKAQSGNVVRPYRSIREAAYDLRGVSRELSAEEFLAACWSGGYNSGVANKHFHGRMKRITESVTTTSWATMLGDAMTRVLLDSYADPTLQDWKLLVSRWSNPKDFSTNRRYRYGGYNMLPVVGERQPYLPLTTPINQKVDWTVAKRGGLEDLTLEAIAADDLGVIRDIPIKLGRAAALTVYYEVMQTLRGVTPATIYDTKALYATDHPTGPADAGTAQNYTATALDRDALKAARKAMRKFTAYGRLANEMMSMQNLPKILWVCTTLEDMADILIKSPTIPQPASAAGGYAAGQILENSTVPNNLARGMDYRVVDYWDSVTTGWFLTADPKYTDLLEFGFWEGREEPELFTEAATSGSQFNADTITHKIRHAWGYAVLDWRGFFRGNTAV